MGEDFDRVAERPDCGEHIHGHCIGGRPGQPQLLAGLARAHAFGADAAAVHKQEEGLLMAGQKDLPLQLEELKVNPARPGGPGFRLGYFLDKVEDDGPPVFPEKPFAFSDRWNIGRTAGRPPIFPAAELAFQADPLGDRDLLRVEPAEIRKSVLAENYFKVPFCGHEDLLRPFPRQLPEGCLRIFMGFKHPLGL